MSTLTLILASIFSAVPAAALGAQAGALITNSYAYHHAAVADAVRSPNWELTAGSLFFKDGWYWTGNPDHVSPDPLSTTGTGSAVFRAVTARRDFRDASVRLAFRLTRLDATQTTPAMAWDGIHIFLRYQNQYSLYYASVARRDGTVVIKKKCPGGPSNGGTYYDLSPYVYRPAPIDTAVERTAEIRTLPDGGVEIAILENGQALVTGIDRGVGCPVILEAGATGVRGDNAEFFFILDPRELGGALGPSGFPKPSV